MTDSYYGTSCASDIYLGEESLIGIYQDSEDGELKLGSSCSLAMGWPEDVSDEDVALLEAGCVEDPCDVSSYEDGLVVGCDDDPCGGGCLEFEVWGEASQGKEDEQRTVNVFYTRNPTFGSSAYGRSPDKKYLTKNARLTSSVTLRIRTKKMFAAANVTR